MQFDKLFRKKSVSKILKEVAAGETDAEHHSLQKHLGVRDLTSFGIAAIIGAGIFSTIGQASADGGPGVIFLFLFTALACGFSAFAYAEFASMVPVSGSAYTYSYVAFGELIAWIIGWALIMEYAVGNVTVAVSWSDYVTGLLDSIHIGSFKGIHVAEWASIDYVSASKYFATATEALASGSVIADLPPAVQTGYLAWVNAPTFLGFHMIIDIPAILIVILITRLVYIGIKETRNASNIMVIIKLSVVFLVIAIGAFYVDFSNWSPFMPNGVGGVLKGVSAVFFAYIGFDAISTTAEECRNPSRDLPKAIMNAILICTVLYIFVALTLTGMVKYDLLGVGDPLAFVFGKIGLKWISGIIAVSAVVAISGVLLVFQMGQPRIWMSMSRDGLLPKKFSTISKKYKTPSFSTITTGFFVAIPTLFIPSDIILDLCSMGTLFAFVVVCAGVLKLQNDPDAIHGKFRTPYLNAKFIMPALSGVSVLLLYVYGQDWLRDFFTYGSWSSFKDKIPMWLFLILCLIMSVLSFIKNLSLIPVLGLIFCFYMMAQIQLSSWLGFLIWLIIGLAIYFLFGYRNSKLAIQK
ncbi:MAG: amino acid permease [Bacteroidota bacterium]